MVGSIWTYANPTRFIRFCNSAIPLLLPGALISIVVALVWGFFFTPDDYRQGASVKIIYLHVPAAIMAINAWACMLVSALIWLVRRHIVSAFIARAAAPVGAVFTVIALATGALWGRQIWGTYWAWDPRLTSFFILFFFYLGYIGLWSAIEPRDSAASLTSILAIVGSVFAVLSRYAVDFWAQGLHQGDSLSLNSSGPIAGIFYWPLTLSIFGFVLLFAALVLLRARNHIWAEKLKIYKMQKGP